MRALLLAMTCTLLACGQGEPDDPFFLIGTVLDGAHQRVPQQAVTLLRGRNGGCLPFREASQSWSDSNTQPASPFQDARADEHGQFLFELLRYEIAPREGLIYCFEVTMADPGGAASVLVADIYATDFVADEFYLWREGVTEVSSIPEGHLLSSPPGPLPPTGVFDYSVTRIVAYEWDVTAGGLPLWRSERTEAPLVLDDRLREDFGEAQAKVDLLAHFFPEVNGPFAGSYYRQYSSGPPSPVPALAPRVPPSRGARCGASGTDLDPCPYTDGKLDLVTRDLGPNLPEGGGPALVLELATPLVPTSLVVRDVQAASGPWIVEGSADGTTWERLGQLDVGSNFVVSNEPPMTTGYQFHAAGYFVEAPLTASSQPVSLVRIRPGTGLVTMRELSVF